MPRADQKRDRFGRFADEGRGEFSDAALVARSRKRIVKYTAQIQVVQIRAADQVRELQAKIAFEQERINSLT